MYPRHRVLNNVRCGVFVNCPTVFFMIACLRSSIALVTLFFFVVIALALLTAASFKADMTLQKAGGIFGLISGSSLRGSVLVSTCTRSARLIKTCGATAFVGYYTALCGLMTPESTLFTLPRESLPSNAQSTVSSLTRNLVPSWQPEPRLNRSRSPMAFIHSISAVCLREEGHVDKACTRAAARQRGQGEYVEVEVSKAKDQNI